MDPQRVRACDVLCAVTKFDDCSCHELPTHTNGAGVIVGDLDPPDAWIGNLRFAARQSLCIPADFTVEDVLHGTARLPAQSAKVVCAWWEKCAPVEGCAPRFVGTLIDDSAPTELDWTHAMQSVVCIHLLYLPPGWDRAESDPVQQYAPVRGQRITNVLNDDPWWYGSESPTRPPPPSE